MESRYRIVRPLAKGGMAEVFQGFATGAEGFARRVAIKRVLPHLMENEQVARMFLSEAQLATHLHHQNIVQVIDVQRGAEGLLIVMELVNGWDLGILIDHAAQHGQTFPPHLAAFVASQAMAGLCHAYRQRHEGKPLVVAHRDISPSNVLVSVDGEVKVADFGIAKIEGASAGTEPGVFKGKIAYAAPEVLRGQVADVRSDQFAMGVVLYEMLTGRPPFGSSTNWMAYVEHLRDAPAPSVEGMPPELATLLSRALEKDPAHRFESPDVFARGLAGYLARCGLPATAAELADHLRSMNVPPPAVEAAASSPTLGASEHQDPSQRGTQADFGTGSKLFHDPMALNQDWVPTGPAMGEDGRVSGGGTSPGAAAGASAARCTVCGDRLRSADASCPRCSLTSGPALTLMRKVAVAKPPSAQSERLVLSSRAADERMEGASSMPLPDDRAPEERVRQVRPPRDLGPLLRRMAAVSVLAAAVGGGVWAWPWLKAFLPGPATEALKRAAPPTDILSLDSEPDGANVLIGGKQVGQTPMYLENIYPEEDIPITISKPGFKSWTGTFRGGKSASVHAPLSRR
jgi:eukaryotic-like serine/threonine-protein kinase